MNIRKTIYTYQNVIISKDIQFISTTELITPSEKAMVKECPVILSVFGIHVFVKPKEFYAICNWLHVKDTEFAYGPMSPQSIRKINQTLSQKNMDKAYTIQKISGVTKHGESFEECILMDFYAKNQLKELQAAG